MEKSEQNKTAQPENHDGSSIERKSERDSEYHFFIARNIQDSGRELIGKDAEGGEKKEVEQDQIVDFFLSDS